MPSDAGAHSKPKSACGQRRHDVDLDQKLGFSEPADDEKCIGRRCLQVLVAGQPHLAQVFQVRRIRQVRSGLDDVVQAAPTDCSAVSMLSYTAFA